MFPKMGSKVRTLCQWIGVEGDIQHYGRSIVKALNELRQRFFENTAFGKVSVTLNYTVLDHSALWTLTGVAGVCQCFRK